MAPLLEAFAATVPGVEIDYVEFQTVDLYTAMMAPDLLDGPDLVISSAMDLQVDLVNRGLARRISLPPTTELPGWASWRSELFGFTFEPAVLVYDHSTISEAELPRSHRDLATFIRENEDRLRGRIGTYDIRDSGIGYLYATQDSLQGVQALRLFEVLGRADVKTYCCTSDMVNATEAGELAFAINAISSYASTLAEESPNLSLHFFDDYNLAMSRTAFVPKTAAEPELAALFIAFLTSREGQRIIAEKTTLLPLIPSTEPTSLVARHIQDKRGTFLPIRLTPGLLTFLDALKREEFLTSWDLSLGRQE